MVARTTAPPVMSRFIEPIEALGLIERPPVSKVMPLPTRTTSGSFFAARAEMPAGV